ADAPVRASLERIGMKLAEVAATVPACATTVVTTSDPDDEVRMEVRGIIDATRAGVPLERMAVLYGSNEPYARLVHEHLDLAGIPHNGASVTTLVDSVLGRSLLRLFALADGGFARDDIGAFLTAAPVLAADGKPASAVEWERMSREAGVVRGLDEWRTRLDAFAMKLGSEEWNARKQEHVAALRAFIESLANELEAGAGLRAWAELGTWAHRAIAKFFGREARRTRWSLFEQEAARRVETTIDRLATLDGVDDQANLDAFRRTLELELTSARVRVGRLGEGVLAGPVSFALGVDLDRTWILGLAEGVFPGVRHDDPLLADRDRAVLDGALRLRSERVDDDHRMFLAALASTAGDRFCSYPRGDLRRSTEHVPSRFLTPTIDALGVDAVVSVASHAQGLAQTAFPATEHELAVRAALGDAAWVRDLAAVAQGVDLVEARSSSAFTRFDGSLGHLGDRLARISPAASDRAISPTRLETWANCPHAYFMQSILGIEPIERPESILQLSPLDRGTIMHEVLDRFLTTASERNRDELRAIALDVFREAEASGITGRPLLWRRDQRLILSELDAFLVADESYRAEFGARTLATELGFGVTGAEYPAVEVALADGRTLRMRGKADRIDQRADGALVVIDYKTGRPDSYRDINGDDPVPRGRFLQLPIYA
ncbi:MAG TPA: PD-(D/E)XK nuclease family protein, partial [Acidimicrobiia bacterium]|nr:PD-(D/E)XK nuclease family protein [Acidimicrobiia bacterium]